jgi:calcium-dependent protein kinase
LGLVSYCEGGELFERLEQQGNFNEKDARELFTQIIKSIKYLHLQNIAHRDLKPENFLMNSRKNLDMKIIDFGLSYPWKNDMRAELLASGRNKLVGTSYYIAPEVLSLNYDQRCDIWSAGVILYILTTAAPPFDGENDREIMENVKKMKYTFDSTLEGM